MQARLLPWGCTTPGQRRVLQLVLRQRCQHQQCICPLRRLLHQMAAFRGVRDTSQPLQTGLWTVVQSIRAKRGPAAAVSCKGGWTQDSGPQKLVISPTETGPGLHQAIFSQLQGSVASIGSVGSGLVAASARQAETTCLLRHKKNPWKLGDHMRTNYLIA